MTLTNSAARYGTVTKTFHWLTALLIVSVIPLGIIANDMAHQIRAGDVDDAFIQRTALLFSLHKTIGLTIFAVALARILWALTQTKPAALHPERKAETFLAELVHWLLYAALLLVPLSGWIHHAATSGFAPIWWPFGQTLPFVPQDDGVARTAAALHIIFERVLVASILLHVLGALKHHLIDKDATLRRMWFGRTTASPDRPKPHRALAPAGTAVVVYAGALAIGAALGLFRTEAGAAPTETLAEVASDWTVTEGEIAITVVQFGSEVEGSFGDWTAAITYDPEAENPKGRVETTIAIPSLSLGSVTDQAMGPDYFDSTTYPTATFTAEILETDTGHVADGTLTLKGETVPVTLPFDLTLDGDTATASGSVTLLRRDFGIGTAETTVGYEVGIDISLTAQRGQDG